VRSDVMYSRETIRRGAQSRKRSPGQWFTPWCGELTVDLSGVPSLVKRGRYDKVVKSINLWSWLVGYLYRASTCTVAISKMR